MTRSPIWQVLHRLRAGAAFGVSFLLVATSMSMAAQDDAGLSKVMDGKWFVTYLAGLDTGVPLHPQNPHISFGADRSVSGFAGCNRFGGTYALSDGVVTFGQFRATRMFCHGDRNRIERSFFKALSRDRQLNVVSQPGHLIFMDPGREVVMRLDRDAEKPQ